MMSISTTPMTSPLYRWTALASAIAGRVMVRRLRTVFAKLHPDIAEDEEVDADFPPAVVVSIDNEWTDGCELLEPFPSSYEEWNEKKKQERKERHKSKKHHKQSKESRKSKDGRKSKDSSRGDSHGSTKRRDKQGEQHQHLDKVEEASPPPPIMEISIEPMSFPSSDFVPELLPSPSIVRHSRRSQEPPHETFSHLSFQSMEDSSNSRSAGVIKSTPHQQRTSFTGGGAMGVAIKKSMENRSALDTECLTQISGQSNHTTGHLSGGGDSHATTENIDQLCMMLEHARMEERQVMVIHKKLEKEVEKLMEREIMADNQRLNINLELQTASLEHERLERQVEILHKENDDLCLQLSIMEEREGNRGLDDVLDNMEAKIKQLKLKRRERRVSSPKEEGKKK